MILNNLLLAGSGELVNIRVDDGKITGVSGGILASPGHHLQLSFDQAIVFPGLINSHDHLDFNLFPQLGGQIYNNYTEWGKFIHEHYKAEILKVLKVPVLLREQWGIMKNLICGVTTVVNHGEKIKIRDTLITVHEKYYCLHSVKFEKKWRLKLNHPLKTRYPVVIHIGEGTDEPAHDEIDQLTRWNLLRKTLIGVHGVGMSAHQAAKFKAIVWCPQSNFFLLNKTAAVNDLKAHTRILFGTDSTLTGNWNIWDHIELARKTKKLSDEELYHTLNQHPASVWKINTGALSTGNNADLVIAKRKGHGPGLEAFFNTSPKDILLVVHQGNIRLFDETIYDQLYSQLARTGHLTNTVLSGFSKIYVDGACKYVQGDVPRLMKNIKQYYPEAIFPLTIS